MQYAGGNLQHPNFGGGISPVNTWHFLQNSAEVRFDFLYFIFHRLIVYSGS